MAKIKKVIIKTNTSKSKDTTKSGSTTTIKLKHSSTEGYEALGKIRREGAENTKGLKTSTRPKK